MNAINTVPRVANLSGNRVTRVLLYLLLATGFAGPALLAFPVGPIHLFPARILLVLLFSLFSVDIITRSISSRWDHIKTRWHFTFLLFWLLFASLSFAWANDKMAAIQNLVYLVTGILIIAAMTYYLTEAEHLLKVFYLFLAAYAIFLLIGAWEITTGNRLPTSGLYGWENPYPGHEVYERLYYMPTGVFRNPNDLATFLTIGIAFTLTWGSRTRDAFRLLVSLVLLFGGLFVLIKTESRANYYAVILVFVVWAVVSRTKIPKWVYIVVAVGGFWGLVWFFPNTSDLIDFVEYQLFGSAAWESRVRRDLILYAAQGLVSNFGLGLGAGNIESYMSQFAYYTGGVTNVHNWWVEIAANYGVIVFVGYIVFYTSLVRNTYAISRKAENPINALLGEALFLALIGLIIGSISSSSVVQHLFYWMFLGFATALVNSARLAKGTTTVHARAHHPNRTVRNSR